MRPVHPGKDILVSDTRQLKLTQLQSQFSRFSNKSWVIKTSADCRFTKFSSDIDFNGLRQKTKHGEQIVYLTSCDRTLAIVAKYNCGSA